MTVIEFGKTDSGINKYIAILVVVLVISAVYGIVSYNNLITLRHDLTNNEDTFAQLQVQTAELKNKLYAVMDGVSNPQFVQSTGLVQDKNPNYITPSPVISQATQ